MAYRIEYTPESIDHMETLTAGERALVLDAADLQLAHQPTVETRKRKPMRPNVLGAAFGVDHEQALVTVRGVGVKDRNRVRLGQEWVVL